MSACRPARPEDMAQVIAVWTEAFGDTPPEIEADIAGFVGPENLFVAGEAEVDAILSAVPCRMAGMSGAYLYALATRKERRGQGLMGELMAYSEEACRARGDSFACLVPGESSLFGYYERQGYHTSRLRRLEQRVEAGGPVVLNHLGAAAYAQERAAVLPAGAVTFDEGRFARLLGLAEAQGFACVAGSGAAAVYARREEALAVAELLARDEAAGEALLSALAAREGVRKAVLTLPVEGLWAGQGTLQPAAQFKPLREGRALPEAPYLRFGMDEVFQKDYEPL